MNGDFKPTIVSGNLSERGKYGYRPDVGLSHDDRRDVAAGEVLAAQWPTRVFAAMVVAVLQLAVSHPILGGARPSAITGVLAAVAGYVLLVLGVHALVRRRHRATPGLVTGALLSDLLFVYCLTYTATTPGHYERGLFGTIVAVHVANYFFGRRQAWRTVYAGLAGYVALLGIATMRGLQVDVAEELWTLALFAAGIVLIVLQAGDVRRRLRTIVGLFEQAEDGDFSRAYDAEADGRPDAITRVGIAYNGVRAQLENMVLTDPLTGCLNRRGFDQALARETARASRAGNEFALLALDLDHFKQVNDTYGHLAGDVVLRAVGALLLKAGRAGDVVARVGGEEFAILLAETGAHGAQLFATRLCERIRAHPFPIGHQLAPMALTTSVGVAVGSPRGVAGFAEMLWSRADDALYAAKGAGRNCVRAWTADTRHSGDHVMIGSVNYG